MVSLLFVGFAHGLYAEITRVRWLPRPLNCIHDQRPNPVESDPRLWTRYESCPVANTHVPPRCSLPLFSCLLYEVADWNSWYVARRRLLRVDLLWRSGHRRLVSTRQVTSLWLFLLRNWNALWDLVFMGFRPRPFGFVNHTRMVSESFEVYEWPQGSLWYISLACFCCCSNGMYSNIVRWCRGSVCFLCFVEWGEDLCKYVEADWSLASASIPHCRRWLWVELIQ